MKLWKEWGIGETEGHDKLLDKTVTGSEGSCVFFASRNTNEIECTREIKLGKELDSV